MAVYKLLDEDLEHVYSLIAIHASLDDYKLAYLLNSELNLRLKRMDDDGLLDHNASVAAFQWYDEIDEVFWGLVKNKAKVELETGTSGLFENNKTVHTQYVVPENRRADYLLKIDDEQGDYNAIHDVIHTIKKIPGIITAYKIDIQELKSKNNLIFLTNA